MWKRPDFVLKMERIISPLGKSGEATSNILIEKNDDAGALGQIDKLRCVNLM